MSKNKRRRKILKTIVFIIDNLSIGFLWAAALTMLAYAILSH